jgi:hypothetical protein
VGLTFDNFKTSKQKAVRKTERFDSYEIREQWDKRTSEWIVNGICPHISYV